MGTVQFKTVTKDHRTVNNSISADYDLVSRTNIFITRKQEADDWFVNTLHFSRWKKQPDFYHSIFIAKANSIHLQVN